ncbi:MAG: prepilin-type N-terminal cleavage/methylation domain-containing protein [Deltaproteobacteria bacterium]|nr:prepilin-type N-terminal cleavage/methylation domain-containing protein [Deltaproteobacteria bacterium]
MSSRRALVTRDLIPLQYKISSCSRNDRNESRNESRNKSRGEIGFTLIEVMVVAAIIGIVAIIATPNLIGYYRSSQVGAAMREFYGGFIEAQGFARSTTLPHQIVVDRANQQWHIRKDSDRDGNYETLIKTKTLSATEVGFGPTAGYGANFPVPYNGIASSSWCSFCGGGNTGNINFIEDGTVLNGTSGAVLIYDASGTSARIDALVFVGASGDARIFRRN